MLALCDKMLTAIVDANLRKKYLWLKSHVKESIHHMAQIEELYRNDINKIDRSYRAKVLFIYDQIPAFLSQHEKRVRLSNIEEKTKEVLKVTFKKL